MGEYRTFSQKNHKSGINPVDRQTLSPGNVECSRKLTKIQPSPATVLVRGENTWTKWKIGSNILGKSKFKDRFIPIWQLALYLLLLQTCTCVSAITTLAEKNSDNKPSTLLIVDPVEFGSSGLDNIVEDTEESLSSLTAQLNCTRPSSDEFPADLFTKEERQHGAIAIHFFVTLYMLYALLLICDEYFVPAVECICQDLRIPHNIAGATLMAISTSAPELFTNVIGTFVTQGDLGLGTIVGSAVFNMLAVGACVGIGANFVFQYLPTGTKRTKFQGVPLNWWSLTRDSVFYLIAVSTLVAVLFDGRVYWHEAIVLVAIYGVYILAMRFDTKCMEWTQTFVAKVQQTFGCSPGSSRKLSAVLRKVIVDNDDDENAPLIRKGSSDSCYGSNVSAWNDMKIGNQDKHSKYSSDTHVSNNPIHDDNSKKDSIAYTHTLSEESLDDCNSCSSSASGKSEKSTSSSVVVLEATKDIITFPVRFLMHWTVPDCKKQNVRKWCIVSLISCIVWIGGLAYVISWMVCIIGGTFEIPDSVSGLTFLAAGTSLPEVLSSVIVARQGHGSMAFSNSIGSNTFDILICLGLPWLIQTLVLSSNDTNYIEIHSVGLEYSSVLLISSLVLLYTLIAANGYKLDMKIGIACVLMYVVFITFACLLEMNVFFPVNLPSC